jgi:hypothetical protein
MASKSLPLRCPLLGTIYTKQTAIFQMHFLTNVPWPKNRSHCHHKSKPDDKKWVPKSQDALDLKTNQPKQMPSRRAPTAIPLIPFRLRSAFITICSSSIPSEISRHQTWIPASTVPTAFLNPRGRESVSRDCPRRLAPIRAGCGPERHDGLCPLG